MEIHKKILSVKKVIGKISKDSNNPFFKSKYFDVNTLLEHVEPLLQENNLLLLQPIKDGMVCSVITDVDSSDTISSSIKLPELQDPQKLGSAITYYRRYTLQSLLGLQAEDDDSNLASGKTKKPVAQSNNRQIKEWLTEEQFKKAMESGKKAIAATISVYTSGDKGMKKEYMTKLTNQLKTLK